MMRKSTYEITVEIENGDWRYKRIPGVTFHVAALHGLLFAALESGWLISVHAVLPEADA